MTAALLRALWLELRRDRGALVMAFVLPVVFFLVFAFIFASSGGTDLQIRIAVADTVADDDTRALVAFLARDDAVELVGDGAPLDPETVRERVRKGKADVGLVVRSSLRSPDAEVPPVLILYDPTREVAASMLTGRVQRAYVQALPDLALGGVIDVLDQRFLALEPAQKQRLDQGLSALRNAPATGSSDLFGSLYARETVAGEKDNANLVAYYAGAVAILFALFSAVHGAIALLDERDAGIIDRVLAGPAGTRTLVNARFLFLTLQGFAQVGIIFLVAWLGYGVDVPAHIVGWGLTTLAVSVCAAGLSLALVVACGTRRQAQTVSNVAILILSAVGGSMVPRFFMPPLLQHLGWLTPNTWALEAYTSVFWRGDPLSAILLPVGVLLAAGIGGLLAARGLARRWEVM